MTLLIVAAFVITPIAAVPDLTDGQRRQLASAEDRNPSFNRPAIFPLLRNAIAWTPPVDRSGATIPDYAAITRNPTTHRGGLFLIEGVLARIVPTGPLAQPGPWDGRLKEWDIVVQEDPVETAVVFLVDPPTDPRQRSQVEIVARFYKIMRRRDVTHDEWMDFPVFVGRSGTVTGPFSSDNAPPASMPILLLMIVVAMAVAYFLVRRSARAVSAPRRASRPQPDVWHDDSNANTDLDAPLPTDSDEALEELRRRHDEGKGPPTHE